MIDGQVENRSTFQEDKGTKKAEFFSGRRQHPTKIAFETAYLT
jgi:hypothetical protein